MLAPSIEVQDLQRGRNLIADGNNWCRGTRHSGNKHCALGALETVFKIDDIYAAKHDLHQSHVLALLGDVAHEFIRGTNFDFVADYRGTKQAKDMSAIAIVNDGLGHIATLNMFDHAIRRAMQPA